ncbi:MAG: sulfatase-like hydrolase/transferase [Phycisphaera sp. RhM]|nr:sulfatase-like hydrolase/transferase [Phycisphaera sp. RhM]
MSPCLDILRRAVTGPTTTGKNHPVFLHVAYTAPHWALHAPDDEIAKYRGRYAGGWQPVREARFECQMNMGMFPSHTTLSNQEPGVPAWHKVEATKEMDLRMATHAAMVHLVDRGVGRIVSKLNELEQLDNTLILFLSDNGTSAESGPTGLTGARGGDPKARTGTPDSYNGFEIAGANMCDTPFRKYKMFVHEGGVATPLITHWPTGIPAKLNGHFSHELGHVIDLLPTCADVAGATYPQIFEGRAVTPALVHLQLSQTACVCCGKMTICNEKSTGTKRGPVTAIATMMTLVA